MRQLIFASCLLWQSLLFAQQPSENYPVDSASVEHPGVPKGEILKFIFDQSKIFPGTWREYWVYVPAQYKPDQACLRVCKPGWHPMEGSNRI